MVSHRGSPFVLALGLALLRPVAALRAQRAAEVPQSEPRSVEGLQSVPAGEWYVPSVVRLMPPGMFDAQLHSWGFQADVTGQVFMLESDGSWTKRPVVVEDSCFHWDEPEPWLEYCWTHDLIFSAHSLDTDIWWRMRRAGRNTWWEWQWHAWVGRWSHHRNGYLGARSLAGFRIMFSDVQGMTALLWDMRFWQPGQLVPFPQEITLHKEKFVQETCWAGMFEFRMHWFCLPSTSKEGCPPRIFVKVLPDFPGFDQYNYLKHGCHRFNIHCMTVDILEPSF